MPHSKNSDQNKLTNLQLEFLKSLKYMATERQLNDVKSLLRHYFAQQLDGSIERQEKESDYTAAVYESWLKNNATKVKSARKQ